MSLDAGDVARVGSAAPATTRPVKPGSIFALALQRGDDLSLAQVHLQSTSR